MENYINVSIFFNVLLFGIALLLARGLWKTTELNEELKEDLQESEDSVQFWREKFKSQQKWAKRLQQGIDFQSKERELKSAFEKSHDTIKVPILYSMTPNEFDIEKFNESMENQKISSKDLVDFLYLWGRK